MKKSMRIKVSSLVLVVMMVFAVGAVYGDDLIRNIEATFNSGIAVKVNGNLIHSDEQGAIVYNDRTYVPARALCEALKADVQWDEPTQTVKIDRLGKIEIDGLKPIAEKYLANTKGKIDIGSTDKLLNIDLQGIADMGFEVRDYGDKSFQLINIGHPNINAGEENATWTQAVKLVGGALNVQFQSKWTFISAERNRGSENLYIETFVKDGVVAVLIVDKNSVGLMMQHLEDYIQSRIKGAHVSANGDVG